MDRYGGHFRYHDDDAAIHLNRDGEVVYDMAQEEEHLEASMNAIDRLPDGSRQVFVEVLIQHDPAMLQTLTDKEVPTQEERESVLDILADEFMENLEPNYEPTERGKLIDNALGAFLLAWPIESE